MRKKIVSLIREVTPYWAEVLADYLLINGLTIPVQCKSCQHHEPSDVRNRIWCRNMCRYMKEDGFCSEGVKMDG